MEGIEFTGRDQDDPRAWRDELLPPLPEAEEIKKNASILALTAPGKTPVIARVFGRGGGLMPVILLHGLQSHSGWFVQSAHFMAGIGHPVYALDRVGSGLSPAPRGDVESFDQLLEEISILQKFVAGRHGSQNIHLLGHCYGALPALAFACRHSRQVRTLILTTPGLYTHTDLSLKEKTGVAAARLTGRNPYFRVPLDSTSFTKDPRLQEFIERDPLALREASARFWTSVRAMRRFVLNNFVNLHMPVFMGVASRDPVADTAANLAFLCRLPSAIKWSLSYDRSLHVLEFGEDRDVFFGDLALWFRRFSP